jgi:choice-of-anchor C domain-containing protein
LRKSLIFSLVVGLGTMLTLPASAQVNLIQNGSFESPVIGGAFSTIPPGPGLTNWTVGGAGVDLIRTFWQPAEGAQSLDLSALDAGSVSQTVATSIGTTYDLLFDMAGNPGGGNIIKNMVVSITGASNSLQQFNTTGFSNTNMGWSARSLFFTATSTSTVIAFTSQEANVFGPALDNVRLFERASGIAPEPGTLALLGSSLLMVGILRRRRIR